MRAEASAFIDKAREFLVKAEDMLADGWPDEAGRAAYLAGLDAAQAVIVERTAFADGKITLVFDRKTHDLKQWIITDAQGLNTSVAIYNVSVGKTPDPGLFKITYLDSH